MSGAAGIHAAVSAQEIATALDHVGVRGRPIAVHASLSAFGHVAGGADALVAAVAASCPTVLAPAFCFEPNWAPPLDDRPDRNGCDYAYYDDWDRPRTPWFVETAPIDPSMGTTPLALARRTGTLRSNHPWHSWLAHGVDAASFIHPHPWETTNLPLERLAAAGGHVVLMGVDLRSCTAVHVAEERAGRRPFIRWMVGRDDQVRRIRVAGCSKAFDRLWPHCGDLFAEASVGSAFVKAAPLEPLLGRLADAFRAEPQLTVCSESCLRCRDAAAGGPRE